MKIQGSFSRRAILGDIFYGYTSDDWGITGLVERSTFAFLPIGMATRWKSNKSIKLATRSSCWPREGTWT